MKKFIMVIVAMVMFYSLAYAQPGNVGTACNNFIYKYNIQNGGANWGAPFIDYALYKGRTVRSGVTTFYAHSWEGDSLGGGNVTAWGINTETDPLKSHLVAADRRYYGAGSVVYIKAIKDSNGNQIWPRDGSPGRLMIVADAGGAIKGPYRFDISVAGQWDYYRMYDAKWNIQVFVIYRTPAKRSWGQGNAIKHINRLQAEIKAQRIIEEYI
jgi:3D (Asp-Asp-Asp) domain-containing protein